VNRAPSAAAFAAALGLAVLAPGAAAQDPTAMLEAVSQAQPAAPAIPQQSVISERYREIEVVVKEALPAASAAKPAAPPPAPPAPAEAPKPEYRPEPQQYHSKSAPDVTVTQQNPENVNVSIRINSPGDDGPVTQTNTAGGIHAPAPATPPEAPKSAPVAASNGAGVQPAGSGSGASADGSGTLPEGAAPGGGLPDNWEWIWTSACFGGAGGAPAAAAATSGWVWHWSCDEDLPPPNLADAIGELPRPDALPTWPSVAAAIPDVEALIPALTGGDRQAAPRPQPERAQADSAGGPVRRERPPPPAATAPASVGSIFASAPRSPVTSVAQAASPARPKAQARPRDVGRASTLLPSGGGGHAAGSATGGGGAVSLLLAGWLAVLVLALGLVLPRLWLRRWTGPAWRLQWPRATRLERPG
jgi:hypothetical protein